MIEETIVGAAAIIASHCATKSSSFTSPASAAGSVPQPPRKARTSASWTGSRVGGGSGIQRLIWKPPLLAARRSAAQAAIAAGDSVSAPQAPSPPALATAAESEGGQAPA